MESIIIRAPTKYAFTHSTASDLAMTFTPPPLSFMTRTWSVTHSTLPMWRKAKNVRITYSTIESPASAATAVQLDDEVTSEPIARSILPQPKSIKGIDTAVGGDTGVWDWKGKGWLKIAGGSRWEVLGWGERDLDGGEKEMWMVTCFAPTMFTPMGVDFYSSRREGLNKVTYQALMRAVERMEVNEVKGLITRAIFEVGIEV